MLVVFLKSNMVQGELGVGGQSDMMLHPDVHFNDKFFFKIPGTVD